VLCAALLLAVGCVSTDTGVGERINPVYREMIREWQMRISREGWSDNKVDSILVQFRGLATYRVEIRDRWDTPREFRQKGFSGDCEDIVVFMMGALKGLDYPHGLRVLIAGSLFEDHALLAVQMSDGEWRLYDVASPAVRRLGRKHLNPLVEFDEKHVKWYPAPVIETAAPKGTASQAGDSVEMFPTVAVVP
jgi:hypothetical protein